MEKKKISILFFVTLILSFLKYWFRGVFLGKVIYIKISFKRETVYTRDGRSPTFFKEDEWNTIFATFMW